jgi:hypothetical protein
MNLFGSDSLYPISSFTKPISCIRIKYISDNPIVAIGGWNKQLLILNMKFQNNPQVIYDKQTFPSAIMSLSFIPTTESYVAVSLTNGEVYLINYYTKLEQKLYKHEFGAKALQFKDNNTLVSCGWDGNVYFYDIRSSLTIYHISYEHRCYCLDIKGNYLLCGMSENTASLVDFRSYNTYRNSFNNKYDFVTNTAYEISSCSISSDENIIALGYSSGIVDVKYISNIQIQNTIQYGNGGNNNDFSFTAHQNQVNETYRINKVKFMNKKVICTCGSDGYVLFWDVNLKQKLLHGHTDTQAPIIDFNYVNVFNGNSSNNGTNNYYTMFVYASGNDFTKGPMFTNNIINSGNTFLNSNSINNINELFPAKIGLHNIIYDSYMSSTYSLIKPCE